MNSEKQAMNVEDHTAQAPVEVPMLDLQAQLRTLEPQLSEAVLDVLHSTRYIQGPKVAELEERIASYTGAGHAVAVSSGSDSLLAALMALDIGPGDIVVTTPYSFFATAGVIARLHAEPRFADIDPATYNMDPGALRTWFETNANELQRVKAIIAVHLFGQCAEMDPILACASDYGIPVIEDAAQAIGAVYPSKQGPKKAGAMGTMGCFSFFPSKNLGGVGDGGMVVTNDGELAAALRCLRNHGALESYYHARVGGNFRLDAIQAAALLVKLPYIEQWHAMRREHAAYYDGRLVFDGLETPYAAHGRYCHIYNQYVIRVQDRRDALREHLRSRGIDSAIYYPLPFHEQACFAYLPYQQGDFPHSEHAARHTLALPVYPELTQEQQARVVDAIREFLNQDAV